MGKLSIFLLIIGIMIGGQVCQGQSIEVSDPSIELRDNHLLISYDILNSDPSEEFSVRMQITDADGTEIAANALTGDIGDVVKGGSNKLIDWDLTADKVVMNVSIYVKIYAKAIAPIVTEQVAEVPAEFTVRNEPDIEEDKPESVIKDMEEVSQANRAPGGGVSSGFTRSSLILQSLPLPGLGLTRLTGSPHWIRGVAAYGCVAGSIILNNKAVKTYKQIPDHMEYDAKNDLFRESLKQDNISEVLAYSAIAIWVSDVIWTIVGTSDLKKSFTHIETKGFSIRTRIEPLSYAPMVGIRYQF